MRGGKFFSEETFFLKDEDLFSSGSERDCYPLPGHASLCVKIQHGRESKFGQNIQEYKYYKKLEERGIDWSRIARCQGWVETNLGKGLVFDFVCDPDGAPSIRFQEYMERYGLDRRIKVELESLKEYLLANNVVMCDLKTTNLLCQNVNGNPFIKIIDGVGNRDYIKFSNWFPFWGKKKIERHWGRFEVRLNMLMAELD